MNNLSLISTDDLIDELESRFEFFVSARRDPSGKYHRTIFGATDCNGFAILGCTEWIRQGVMEQMGINGQSPDTE